MKKSEEAIWPKGVSNPAQRALASGGFAKLEDLTNTTEADLAKLHGMGPKALGLLKQALTDKGLSFK